MFIAGLASHALSSAVSALAPSTSATTAVSKASTQPAGSPQPNNPTGSTNPFQMLSSDLQSWLMQHQSTAGGSQKQPPTA
jgi:hypothetical protein